LAADAATEDRLFNLWLEEAEIQGRFEGNLVVRKRLLIKASGRVSGTIRYGQIEIECAARSPAMSRRNPRPNTARSSPTWRASASQADPPLRRRPPRAPEAAGLATASPRSFKRVAESVFWKIHPIAEWNDSDIQLTENGCCKSIRRRDAGHQ
jgi:hypothetical protein